MAGTSSLDPDNFPEGGRKQSMPKGHNTKSLGPSDSSDSGSDMGDRGSSMTKHCRWTAAPTRIRKRDAKMSRI